MHGGGCSGHAGLYLPTKSACREAMLMRHLGEATGIACALSSADRAKIVARTAGYSGSDMRALIQEACQVSNYCPCCLLAAEWGSSPA